jgi:hypothetical protein
MIVFLILGVFVGITSEDSSSNSKPVFQNNYVQPEPSSLKVVSIYQDTSFYDINIEYPHFLRLDGDFNSKISAVVNKRLEEFKNSATENWKARRETDKSISENPDTPFYFSIGWTPAQINDKYISLALNAYSFSGGAHGDEEIFSFNYDLTNNKEITITDIIGSGEENLSKFASLAKEDVQNMLGKDNIFPVGTEPKIENFSTFSFDGTVLTVYYQKYQVAPGSSGIVKSIFNKKSLLEQGLVSDYLK